MRADKPLQKYHSFYRFIRSYQGTGHIDLESGKRIDCDFECGQTEEGEIIVCSHQYQRFLPVVITGEIGGRSESRLSGFTSNGQSISANITLLLHLEGSSNPFVSFYARDLMVGDSNASLQTLKYYLVNLEFIFQLDWHIAGHAITIRKIEAYDKAEKEMEATKRAKITAELEIKSEHGSINNISEVDGLANDLCTLLSLAKGCMIRWLYSDGYSSADLPARSYHLNAVISPYSSMHVIVEKPPKDIEDFIEHVFSRYEDIKKENIWKFDTAISHYADTLSSESFLELRALNLVSLVEYLTGRHVEHEKTNKVLKDASFDEKKDILRTNLTNSLTSHFSEEDLVQTDYVSTIKKNMKKGTTKHILGEMAKIATEGLNTRSFSWSLNRLLNNLNLISAENEIKVFVKMRNKLVHEARFLKKEEFEEMDLPYEDEILQFFRIVSITSRMMLGILEYRGYYYDWHLREEVEWAGATKARVQMQYRS